MKNLLLLALILICIPSLAVESFTSDKEITGIWLGTMKISDQLELRIGFVITKNEGDSLIATMNVIEQKAYDIPMDIIEFSDDSLRIELYSANISYTGVFDRESNSIAGAYQQGEARFKLDLNSVDQLPKEVVRTQLPVRPFPYHEEEVVFKNKDANVTLAGTLTCPTTKAPASAIILVHGSGHTDRNGTNMNHFLLLSDYLTRKGFVVLRYDKRGIGSSTGNYDSATTEDFAQDVMAGIEYLKCRAEVDSSKIGLIGHSEGSVIAPMVAAKIDELAFIVLMGGVGVTGEELRMLQIESISRVNGVPDSLISIELAINKKYHTLIKSDDNLETKRAKFKEINPDISEGLMGYLLMPWYKQFIQLDAKLYLEKTSCPVLAVNGENDLQCPPNENLKGIEAALKKGGNKDYLIQTLPKLNHLFQTSKSGSPMEYDQIAEIIAPSALELISDWISRKVF